MRNSDFEIVGSRYCYGRYCNVNLRKLCGRRSVCSEVIYGDNFWKCEGMKAKMCIRILVVLKKIR